MFALAIFVGAFLLFQVQLILGRAILPWFGGTPAVWTTCLAFFQILLLGGYALASASVGWLRPSTQTALHITLVVAACIALGLGVAFGGTPLMPGPSWKPADAAMPAARIVAILTVCAGLPYLVLSSTSPLLQAWFARLWPDRSPYRLYALSNAGSLLGLISYPLGIEPMFGLRTQGTIWVLLFGVYAVSSILAALDARDGAAPLRASGRVPLARGIYWLLLAAGGSMLLVATSNHLCAELSVSPLLWVMPLTVYLLTFIFSFEWDGFYRPALFAGLLVAGLSGSVWVLQEAAVQPLVAVVGISLFTLFCGCMVCHGELVRSKPEPAQLTTFYLTISLGGALGATSVSLLAPQLFSGFYELQYSLIFCAVLGLASAIRDRASWLYRGGTALAGSLATLALGIAWLGRPSAPLVENGTRSVWMYVWLTTCAMLLAIIIVLTISAVLRMGLARPAHRLPTMGAVLVVVAVAAALVNTTAVFRWAQVEYAARNFYGVQRVVRSEQTRMLAHGSTLHGWQRLDQPAVPLGYYAKGSGVALAFELARSEQKPLRVALVGLGAGTLAAWGQAGDDLRFFEIDPEVIRIAAGAQPWFSYIGDSKARVSIVEGDARLSLERESGPFDLLVLDAFSSDVIPVHLLTREAVATYLRVLAPDGIIAVHISNRYLDLLPVVRRLCADAGLATVFVKRDGEDILKVESSWLLASRSARRFESALAKSRATPQFDEAPASVLWTDDYSNVLQALRR